MSDSTVKNKHMTPSDRFVIEKGITNGATQTAIAADIGKDKSTVGKEIKNHREPRPMKSDYPCDCKKYRNCPARCDSQRMANECNEYEPFKCRRRDSSPGACNGCSTRSTCHYRKYYYYASNAQYDYKQLLTGAREGVNATVEEVRQLGNKIKPLLEQGQSLYVICLNEDLNIEMTPRTLYSWIEDGVFQQAGVSISAIDLKRVVRRRTMTKDKRIQYKKRQDRSYLKGRLYEDYLSYIDNYPESNISEMDTVYNGTGSSPPYIQTFKLLRYDLMIAIYHEEKTSEEMLEGMLYLEKILGAELFRQEFQIVKTDRGSEFIFPDRIETAADGSYRTHMFYCDAMASGQKGSLENVHIRFREICPKGTDLKKLGLTSQAQLNKVLSHINSYRVKKLSGKSALEVVRFFNPDLFERLKSFGIVLIPPDQVTLKPSVLK